MRISTANLALLLLTALCTILTSVAPSWAETEKFVTGFNQGWLQGESYGHSFTDGWDENEARRLLRLTRESGSKIQRMWVFEGSMDAVAFNREGRPSGIRPEALRNFKRYLEIAREENVQVYLTLFDGNVARHGDTSMRDKHWNILNNKFGHGEDFREKVLTPLLQTAREVEGSVWGVDLINEANALVGHTIPWAPKLFENKWKSLNQFAAEWGDVVRRHGFRSTVSIGWAGAADNILDGRLDISHLDFISFHAYNNQGYIPKCEDLTKLGARSGKPIYLGEFGQHYLTKRDDDELQKKVTKAFLENAQKCGLAGALAWRLSDNRPGAEARYSYEAYGKLRPAYYTLQEFNRQLEDDSTYRERRARRASSPSISRASGWPTTAFTAK